MVESSKILTVSYGTFSCTLEGFEDSFSTMKAIAEYFRDLAERDRYFGAEPPTPDAEMLTRIAEREIERRVEARSDENGIVLRAAEAVAPAAVEAAPTMPPATKPPAEEAVAAASDALDLTSDDQTADDEIQSDDVEEEAAEDAPSGTTFEDMAPEQLERQTTNPDPSSVAAKLQRIRAVVGGNDSTAFFSNPSEEEAAPEAFTFDAGKSTEFEDEAEEAPIADVAEEEVEAPVENAAQEADMSDTEVAEGDDEALTMDSEEAEEADVADEIAEEAEEDTIEEEMVEDEAEAEIEEAEAEPEAEEEFIAEEEASEGDVEEAADEEAVEVGVANDEAVEEEASEEEVAEDEATEEEFFADMPAEDEAYEDEAEVAEASEEEAEVEATAEDDADDLNAADALASIMAATAKSDDQAVDADADDMSDAEEFFADTNAAEVAEDAAEDDADNKTFSDIDTDLIASIAAESEQAEEVEDVAEEKKPSLTARILRLGRKKAPVVEEAVEEPKDDIKLDDVISAIEGEAEEVETASDDEGFSLADMDGADDLTDYEDVASAALDPEDEAELMADLAAVEDEFAADTEEFTADTSADMDDAAEEIEDVAKADDVLILEQEDAVVEDEADAAEVEEEAETVEASAPTSHAEPGTHRLPENDDAAMDRIMEQADEQMDEPEGSRRRQAIAQLKAAVVATEAARQLGDTAKSDAEEQEEYRQDFDDVVRPRRADRLPRAEIRTERPRPAPLKLVASQRIDEERAAGEAVAPRRVATSSADEAANAESFAAYADEVGATELSDLLEAAAAYCADVEGQEDFSRPQIMKKVQMSSKEEFSREDGLRSFGTLLREGRISKVRNGRFQITEQTRFRPEQKAG